MKFVFPTWIMIFCLPLLAQADQTISVQNIMQTNSSLMLSAENALYDIEFLLQSDDNGLFLSQIRAQDVVSILNASWILMSLAAQSDESELAEFGGQFGEAVRAKDTVMADLALLMDVSIETANALMTAENNGAATSALSDLRSACSACHDTIITH